MTHSESKSCRIDVSRSAHARRGEPLTDREKSASPIQLPAVDPSELQNPQRAPRHQWYLPLKIFLEWTCAFFLFTLTIPLMAFLGAIVRLTSEGPAFYSQARVGQNGKIFLMHKLRTMHHDCEAESGPIWSPRNDTRITGFGRFLRQTHLDELPQLFNVLQGHMALIGPRPERPELCALIERRIPRFKERLSIRPGLTGLAQVCLRADCGIHTISCKLAYDLYYIQEVSPGLDLRIAVSTLSYLTAAIFRSVSVRSYSATDQNGIESIDSHSEITPTSGPEFLTPKTDSDG